MTHAAVVKNLKVISIGLNNDRLDVFWEYANPEQALSYEVWIERSGSISGPFSTIAKTYGAVSYTDWTADYDMTQVYYYRLRVVKRDTQDQVQVTKAAWFEEKPDVINAEIRRRNNLLLREYTGVPVLYYPVRNTGTRCPECWGELEDQRVKSKCEVCYDTGYVTGYYTPILMYMNIHEDQNALAQNAEMDEVPIRTATALLTGEFPIHFADLILERNNERWLVSSFDRTEKLRVTASYRVRLHQVLEQDVRFKIPLPDTDIFNRVARSREYTRPYTLNR
jgi:hypothetical protein